MEYKKFDNTIVVRYEKGEEIIEELKKLVVKENIKLAMINGLGATDKFTVGVYSLQDKKYYKKEYVGPYEIVSLHGNITTMNNEPYLHLHMACSDEEGRAVGGHLNSCRISVTCEMFITLLNGTVDRKVDDITGMNVFKFN